MGDKIETHREVGHGKPTNDCTGEGTVEFKKEEDHAKTARLPGDSGTQ